MKTSKKMTILLATVATLGLATGCGSKNSDDVVGELSPIPLTIIEGSFSPNTPFEFKCNEDANITVYWGDNSEPDHFTTHIFDGFSDQIIITGDLTSISFSDVNGLYQSENRDIYSIYLSSTITTLPSYSFNLPELYEIYLPSSIQTIGEHAFTNNYSSGVTTIFSAANLQPKGWADTWADLASLAYIPIWGTKVGLYDKSIYIAINNGSESFAFMSAYLGEDNEYSIPDIVMADGKKYQVRIIHFSSDTVTTIHLPRYLNLIADHTFYNCDALTTIDYSRCLSIDFIAQRAFTGCNALTEIVVPKTVKVMDSFIAEDCPKLTKLSVEEGNPIFSSPAGSNVIMKGKILLSGCQTSKIPANTTAIADFAFYGYGVSNVKFPKGLLTIGESAFMYCDKIDGLVIPNTVKKINDMAFYHCTSLEIVDLADIKSESEIPECADGAFGYNPQGITFYYSGDSGLEPTDFVAKGWPTGVWVGR